MAHFWSLNWFVIYTMEILIVQNDSVKTRFDLLFKIYYMCMYGRMQFVCMCNFCLRICFSHIWKSSNQTSVRKLYSIQCWIVINLFPLFTLKYCRKSSDPTAAKDPRGNRYGLFICQARIQHGNFGLVDDFWTDQDLDFIILLEFSAPFDTIDNDSLLNHLCFAVLPLPEGLVPFGGRGEIYL